MPQRHRGTENDGFVRGTELTSMSVYVASERMYGFGDEFEYVRCGTCSCQQIVTVPADLSKYYPADYYSYAPTPLTGLRREVTARRDSSYFARGPRGMFGRIVASV